MKIVHFFLFLSLMTFSIKNFAMHTTTIDPVSAPKTSITDTVSNYANQVGKYLPSSFWSPKLEPTDHEVTIKSSLEKGTNQTEYNPNDGFDIQMNNTPFIDFAGKCIGSCTNYVKEAATSAINYGKETADNINSSINFVLNPDTLTESYLGYKVDEHSDEKIPVDENHLTTVDYQTIGQVLKNDIVEQATPAIKSAIDNATTTASTVATGLSSAAQVVGTEAVKLGTAIGTDTANLIIPVIAPHAIEYVNSINLPEYTATKTPSTEISISPTQITNSPSPSLSPETKESINQISGAVVNKGIQLGARMISNQLESVQQNMQTTPVVKQDSNEMPTRTNTITLNDQTNTEINNLLQTTAETVNGYSPAAGALINVALNPNLENATNAALTPGVLTTTSAATGATLGAAIGGTIGGAVGYVAEAGVQGSKAIIEGGQQIIDTTTNGVNGAIQQATQAIQAVSAPMRSESGAIILRDGGEQMIGSDKNGNMQRVVRYRKIGGDVLFKIYDAQDQLKEEAVSHPDSTQEITYFDDSEQIRAIKSINADKTYTIKEYNPTGIITTNYDAQGQQIF